MKRGQASIGSLLLSVGLACGAAAVVPPSLTGGRLATQERAEKVIVKSSTSQEDSPEQALRRLEKDQRRLDEILQDLKGDATAIRRALSREDIKGEK